MLVVASKSYWTKQSCMFFSAAGPSDFAKCKVHHSKRPPHTMRMSRPSSSVHLLETDVGPSNVGRKRLWVKKKTLGTTFFIFIIVTFTKPRCFWCPFLDPQPGNSCNIHTSYLPFPFCDQALKSWAWTWHPGQQIVVSQQTQANPNEQCASPCQPYT